VLLLSELLLALLEAEVVVAIAAVKGGSLPRRPLPPALSGGLGNLETAEDLCDIGPPFHPGRDPVTFLRTPIWLRCCNAPLWPSTRPKARALQL
jgi:hypothetical protein